LTNVFFYCIIKEKIVGDDIMEKYNLSSESIDAISNEIIEFCDKNNILKQDMTRIRLSVEEVLLNYRDRFGEKSEVKLFLKKYYSKVKIMLSISGEKVNCLSNDGLFLNSILSNLAENCAKWDYSSGKNVITLSARRNRKVGDIGLIGIALLLGLGVGAFIRYCLGLDTDLYIINNYVNPLKNAFDGVLCVMAILLAFFSFAIGIVQLGSASGFGKLSKVMVRNYFLISLVSTAVVSFAVLPKISLFAADGSTSIIKPIFDVILGFVPNNIIAPFLNFNCMQIVIVGIMFGLSFVAMGEKSKSVVDGFDTINLVAILTNNYLCKFIPIYVFLTAVSLFSFDLSSMLSEIITIVITVIVVGLLILIGYTLFLCIKYKVNAITLWKKFLPIFMINISSASFGASFVHNFNMLAFECGVEGSVVGISLNVGCVLYKPLYGTFLAISTIVMASNEGMTVSVPFVILVILLSVVFSTAIPNIPGGAASIIALMFSQFGLSNSALSLIIAVNAFLQFFIVTVNTTALEAETIIAGHSDNRLDLSLLRKDTSVKAKN